MTLEEYIRLPHRWQWGLCDCTLFAADWVVAMTGKDPGADLRGTYFDAEGAEAILQAAGGAERLVGAQLGAIGFQRVQGPRDGDIALVRAMTGFDAGGVAVKDIPAIRFGPLWALMSARGPMVKSLEWTGVAWRIA
ncbi:hypothetical protein [Mesorhizobium sp.]|uniref:DUF6950 family protein n=1 Tax=Mesorhizobium sp. TaxID=1871066 RepID=UPI000FE7FEF8|nr:hypothetical protein [Mesorhizobium sp.]RWC28805.1 MAG: hypothetical protein EOS27_17850 [Mesorhizobium sp.]TIX28284.1 MAG: hypothetical protein E5V35_02795 [Mesorhizobium sp.]